MQISRYSGFPHHLCVCVECAHLCIHILKPEVDNTCPPLPYFYRHGLLLDLEFIDLASLAEQQTLGVLLSLYLYAVIMLCHHTQLGIRTQVIMVDVASTLLTGPSSRAPGYTCFCLDPTLSAAGRKI